MDVDVSSIIADPQRFNGKSVSFSCRICIDGTHLAYIAASRDGYEQGQVLLVDDDVRICEKLLAILPAYGGGSCIYNEEAWITGSVIGTSSGTRFSMTACRVMRGEYDIHIEVN